MSTPRRPLFSPRCYLLLTTLLMMTPGATWRARAQTNDGPKILFVQVRMEKDKTVKLVDAQVRDGELKPQAASHAEGIHYELLTANGKSLWHGTMTDPTQRVLEVEDPPLSGKLKRKAIQLPHAQFTLRVPYTTNAQRLDFYTITDSGKDGNTRTNKLGTLRLQK